MRGKKTIASDESNSKSENISNFWNDLKKRTEKNVKALSGEESTKSSEHVESESLGSLRFASPSMPSSMLNPFNVSETLDKSKTINSQYKVSILSSKLLNSSSKENYGSSLSKKRNTKTLSLINNVAKLDKSSKNLNEDTEIDESGNTCVFEQMFSIVRRLEKAMDSA
ncbi:MAG: hypothetical protein MHPSP_002212 [Paramarteilia canceri]